MRWLPSSLFGRLMLALIAYGALVALAFVVIVEFTHARFHLESSQRRASGWAGEIATRHRRILERAASGEADPGTRALFARLRDDNPGSDFYLIDADGTILAASVPPAELVEQSVDIEPIRALLSHPDRLPVLVADPSLRGRLRVFSAAAVGPPTAPFAWLVMLLRDAEVPALLAAHSSHRLSDSLVLAVGVTVPALVITTVILFMILRPLRRISTAIAALERVQGGKTVAAVAPMSPPRSELDRLGLHIDAMVQRIGELVQRLQDDDRKMREMFAELSHDLRTPLSVLDGCIEALASKDQGLGPAERRRLLHVAASHSQSLGRLVDSIFALAQLQRPDYQLECEPFFIAEAAQDIALKFTERACNHGIVLEVNETARAFRVNADVLLIERLLDNLLDNAIRHAHGATRIEVDARVVQGDLVVSVSDDGPGLPPPVVAGLRVGCSHTRNFPRGNGSGLGLGLGIACRILELHGSRLELARSDGTGTAFRFVLPVAPDAGQGNRPD